MSSDYETLDLLRDVDAILIPAGTPICLEKGTTVTITQSLGDRYTVHVFGNLARIDGADADALGKEKTDTHIQLEGNVDDKVWAVMRSCFDPEIPVNIVDLGLIYECTITPAESDTFNVHVTMTLTAPGCGMGPVLTADVQSKLRSLDEVSEVNVELVFDPPWNQAMMSDAARLQLNIF